MPKSKAVNTQFRLWAQLSHGYVEVICDRCGTKVASVREGEILADMEGRNLIDILRQHHCKREDLATAWRPIPRRGRSQKVEKTQSGSR